MHAIDESSIAAAMKTKQPLQACLLIAPNRPERHHRSSSSTAGRGAWAERRAQFERGYDSEPCALLQRRAGSKFSRADLMTTAAAVLWIGQLAVLLRKIGSMAKRFSGACKAS